MGHPGTYRGLVEKSSYYVKAQGLTMVKLMPVQEFNEQPSIGFNPHRAIPLGNCRGYEPVACCAAKASSGSSRGGRLQTLEFKEDGSVLRQAGIKVILDRIFISQSHSFSQRRDSTDRHDRRRHRRDFSRRRHGRRGVAAGLRASIGCSSDENC